MSVENLPAHHHAKYHNLDSVVSSRMKNIFHKDDIDNTIAE